MPEGSNSPENLIIPQKEAQKPENGARKTILNSANVAARFHPEIQNPNEKIAQKK